MRAIIPAKASSTRVPGKNWRPFYQSLSLVDINIEALMGAGLDASDIHVSCEDVDRLVRLERRWGITPLPRDPALCDNSVPLTTWIRAICAQVPGDDDLIWSQVCDPLFDEHRAVINKWSHEKDRGFDSICVIHPLKAYLLDEHCRPVGWQFGEWHTPSQDLPAFYTFPFTLSVLTREAIERTGYHIGVQPTWHLSQGGSIDIDTLADFELAQARYEAKHG